jgi:hypothetical protein
MVGWLGTSDPGLHPAIRVSGLIGTEAKEVNFFIRGGRVEVLETGKVHVVREARGGVLGRGRRLVDIYLLILIYRRERYWNGKLGRKWLLCSRRADGNFDDL